VSEAGRVLGVDLGSVRVGLALSDPLGLTAQPLGHQPRAAGALLDALAALVAEHDVRTVVVGLPLRLSGEEGEEAVRARGFARRLAERIAPVPVEMWDERLTTRQATRVLLEGDVSRARRRKVVDAMAAALLLQSWLDAHR